MPSNFFNSSKNSPLNISFGTPKTLNQSLNQSPFSPTLPMNESNDNCPSFSISQIKDTCESQSASTRSSNVRCKLSFETENSNSVRNSVQAISDKLTSILSNPDFQKNLNTEVSSKYKSIFGDETYTLSSSSRKTIKNHQNCQGFLNNFNQQVLEKLSSCERAIDLKSELDKPKLIIQVERTGENEYGASGVEIVGERMQFEENLLPIS